MSSFKHHCFFGGKMKNTKITAVCLAFALASSLSAQEKVWLWQKKTGPGSEKLPAAEETEERGFGDFHDRAISSVTKPYFEVYRPGGESNKQGILIIPGGSYQRVVYDKEGVNYTKAFNDAGYTCFVLVYRTPDGAHKNAELVSLQDAQRAMRVIKANADAFGVDKDKIGVLGSSAGGHVAANLALNFDKEVYEPADRIDAENGKSKNAVWTDAKPAFQILMYPVISMQDGKTHAGSQKNLLGENPSQKQKDEYSLEMHARKDAPIAFLCCAMNDKSVDPEGNIIPYWQALRKANVKTELHIFPASGHGFGITGASGTAKDWQTMAVNWLKTYVK